MGHFYRWIVRCVCVVVITLVAAIPGHGDSLSQKRPSPQAEQQVGEALSRARAALQEAMQALGEAGQLTLDQQLPKLKDQTDKTLKSTQDLLNQWEDRLRHALEQRNERRSEALPPTPRETHTPAEVSPSI